MTTIGQRRDEIMDLMGADNWGMVTGAFENCATVGEIEFELDEMFPGDDNAQLARDIYEELQ